jgi:hypothetical protein
MTKLNDRHYEKFTPSERLNMAIAAMAREDIQEVAHLWQTCPTRTYVARDLEYKERFLSFTLVQVRFSDFCVELYNKIAIADVLLNLFDLHKDNPLINKEDLSEMIKKLQKSKSIHIARLKSVFEGVKEFCGEVGLDAEDFFKSAQIEIKCEKIWEYLEFEKKVEEIYVQNVKANLKNYWLFF